MYLIKKGSVGIRKIKGAAYVEIAKLYSNEVLGELSFFDRLPRSASAVALSDVEVMEIKFDSLDKVYSNVPDYMKAIIACVADRLRKANDTIRRLQKNVIAEGDLVGSRGSDEGESSSGAHIEIPNDIPATSEPGSDE